VTYRPSYLGLSSQEFKEKIDGLKELSTKCSICPHCCGVNRGRGERGFCEAGMRVRISSAFPHFGEEDVLTGVRGSGTIFFAHCNLKCVFCQNYNLSQGLEGREVEVEALALSMLKLQKMGCHNINLVSPSHYVPQIAQAIWIASKEGLSLPIVYNTGGYDSVETLKLLDRIIDIYMPDTKYMDEGLARRYSNIPNYPQVLKAALKEMHRQVGDLIIQNGLAIRGLLIRHLILPGKLSGTKEVLEFIANEISRDTYINLMAQYYPTNKAHLYPELCRRISKDELEEALRHANELGLVNLI
jgi:putative pyruvate formate lyase activating enzyme